jgi:hypothetical protein
MDTLDPTNVWPVSEFGNCGVGLNNAPSMEPTYGGRGEMQVGMGPVFT